ncbi:MAG TPA: MarR family transcriptional regulator [Acidimicrobiales bacterium]|jgi:DNA-binding MarR family transcriptional regulator|nr:MarR family transcriptional regulator [Acidimicrobiales bacterium]
MAAIDEPEPRTEEMSGYLIKRAQAALHVRLDKIVSAYGLGIPQFVVLSLLAETPGLANADLARRAFVTPQSMNEVLKQLESTGLVERRRNPTNARILNAYLTRTGTRKRSAVSSRVRDLEARLLSGLTTDERENLNRALLTIIDNVTPS